MADRYSGQMLNRMICFVADEMRDCWLTQQPKKSFDKIIKLSVSQQRLVRTVWRLTGDHPEGVMLKDLADQLGLSSSAVSVMVDVMVRTGFFERVTSSEDRRKVLIRISAAGKVRTEIYEDFFGDLCRDFIDGQDPEKWKYFIETLEKLSDFMKKKREEKEK